MPTQLIEPLLMHAPLWHRIDPLLLKGHFPQATLFVAPPHAQKLQFISRLAAMLLCDSKQACGQCSPCRWLMQRTHPDVCYVQPEAEDKVIKVDYIRVLQQEIYQTPKYAKRRLVIIEPVGKMNNSAANALLKILEEPPAHVIFILIAEQLSNVLPTILSRCQKHIIPSVELHDSQQDYLALGMCYEENSPRKLLVQQRDAMIETLCQMRAREMTPCAVAANWSVYPFEDLLWFLYLLNADMLKIRLLQKNASSFDSSKINYLALLLHPIDLFNFLEKINAIFRKINHNINLNQTLALEDLLLSYEQ